MFETECPLADARGYFPHEMFPARRAARHSGPARARFPPGAPRFRLVARPNSGPHPILPRRAQNCSPARQQGDP
jgi:hypothetical protein